MISRALSSAALALLVLSLQTPAYAATCSCAGVPLLTLIDTSATEKGQFFITYSVEQHQISDLVSGSKNINDETDRDRSSFSNVLSASYALTDQWGVSALVSHIKHSRTIGSSFLAGETAAGLGDSVILARYTPISITPFSRHSLSLGLGARIPTGKNDFKNDRGFTVSEDMQPSTGAWGTVAWSSYSYAFNQAATLQFTTSVNYTWNEENDRKYSFGDEFNFAFGVSQSIGTWFGYSAAFRYRQARADHRAEAEIPNTGGKWLDFVPAVQFTIMDNLNLSLFGRIPVARNLNGVLQFTTSYSYGLALTYGY